MNLTRAAATGRATRRGYKLCAPPIVFDFRSPVMQPRVTWEIGRRHFLLLASPSPHPSLILLASPTAFIVCLPACPLDACLLPLGLSFSTAARTETLLFPPAGFCLFFCSSSLRFSLSVFRLPFTVFHGGRRGVSRRPSCASRLVQDPRDHGQDHQKVPHAQPHHPHLHAELPPQNYQGERVVAFFLGFFPSGCGG